VEGALNFLSLPSLTPPPSSWRVCSLLRRRGLAVRALSPSTLAWLWLTHTKLPPGSSGLSQVKNSWGAGWGQKGYVYFSRGKHGPLGQCGIATAPSRPLATPEGDSNSSGWKPDGYDIVYDCLSIGTPVNCTQGKECKFMGCTSANTCVAEAAAFCDKLGDDCGGFAYSDNWDVLNAQFFLGGNSSDTTIGCSSDWDTWCKPGKCGPPMSWTRPYGHCEPPPPPPPPL
jgi:hypothetical protein